MLYEMYLNTSGFQLDSTMSHMHEKKRYQLRFNKK